MVKHNNVVPNGHFHKKWQERVKTWFNQPGQKKARRLRRMKKAARIAPRPVSGLLRPAVRCPTLKYNMKIRKGRGFTLTELRDAGICPKKARSIGIAVDHRRRNATKEQLQVNIRRLQDYKARLIVFRRKSGKVQASDKKSVEPEQVTQLKGELMPLHRACAREKARIITDEERKTSAFYQLRQARAASRLAGVLEKKRKTQDQMVKSG